MAMTLLFLFLTALVLLGVALQWERLFYSSCRLILQRVAKKLDDHKSFLFLNTDEKAFVALEDLLELVKTSSLLLKEWEQDSHGKLSLFQLCCFIDECRQRCFCYLKAFHQFSKDSLHPVSYYSKRESFLRGSCYFCSQPILFSSLNKSEVSSEGVQFSVPSCTVCRNTLSSSATVNILCFYEEGKRIHWSSCSSYQPSLPYWNVNRNPLSEAPSPRGAKILKLVYKKNHH